jgi:hypothetical protein
MSDISVDLLEGKCKFFVQIEGEIDAETYKGTFTVKGSLSPLDTIKADRRYRELMGKDIQYATDHASQLAFSLAQLNQRIVDSPDWWHNTELNGGHLDENIIFDVFAKSIECEKEYRAKRKEQADGYKKIINEKLNSGEIAKNG